MIGEHRYVYVEAVAAALFPVARATALLGRGDRRRSVRLSESRRSLPDARWSAAKRDGSRAVATRARPEVAVGAAV